MSKKQNNKLTDKFLTELFKLAITKQGICEVVIQNLSYTYIPVELSNYKKVLKSLVNIYKVSNKLPTIGSISQQHPADIEVQELLEEIKDCKLADEEIILSQLEYYIRGMKFQILNDQLYELYKEGKKEEAIALSAKESEEIHNFSLRNSCGKFLSLFENFEQHQILRSKESEHEISEKVPFGVDPIDDLTGGGIDVTDTALYIGRSGTSKSTWLKWTAFAAARLGYSVLHIQLEGSEKECFDKYSQIWSALDYTSVRNGNIPHALMDKLKKEAKMALNKGKDITIYSFEKFDEASMTDVRDIVLEYQKIKGKIPDLVVVDSLDLLHPGDGLKYGVDTQSIKMKLQNSAKRMKNMAVELKTRILTATQTGDVPPTIWNDIDKVITRNNTEGDRTLVKSFSYVLTFNQTNDEQKTNEARIYIDKFRNYAVGKGVYKICTAYKFGRFYDRKRTLKKYYSAEGSNDQD